MLGERIGLLGYLKYKFRLSRMNKRPRERLDWKHMVPQEGYGMIKGTSKRIIVVKSPDPTIFEQAIFIIRDDYLRQSGVSSAQIIKEAQKVADSYVRTKLGGRKGIFSKNSGPVLAFAGAAASSLVWLAMNLAGVL